MHHQPGGRTKPPSNSVNARTLCVTIFDIPLRMTDKKSLFQNNDLRNGGFYELCIQVCPSVETNPIKLYTNYFWKLDNIEGPFDKEFNKIQIPNDYYELQGLLTLDNFIIPFKNFNIREQEPIETGSNWFDVSFYTTTLDDIFGLTNHHWNEGDSCPVILQNFLIDTMRKLYSIHSFQLAFIDFEISGQYYLNDLKGELNNWTNTKFFVGRENYNDIKSDYKSLVTIVD